MYQQQAHIGTYAGNPQQEHTETLHQRKLSHSGTYTMHRDQHMQGKMLAQTSTAEKETSQMSYFYVYVYTQTLTYIYKYSHLYILYTHTDTSVQSQAFVFSNFLDSL